MSRVSEMSRTDVAARAGHAGAFLAAARLVDELGADAEISPTSNIVGSLAVLAGIAAADALCGYFLAARSSSDDHGEAVRLLASAHPRCRGHAAHLRRLLAAKTNSHYSADVLGEVKARELLIAASRLVEGMRAELDAA